MYSYQHPSPRVRKRARQRSRGRRRVLYPFKLSVVVLVELTGLALLTWGSMFGGWALAAIIGNLIVYGFTTYQFVALYQRHKRRQYHQRVAARDRARFYDTDQLPVVDDTTVFEPLAFEPQPTSHSRPPAFESGETQPSDAVLDELQQLHGEMDAFKEQLEATMPKRVRPIQRMGLWQSATPCPRCDRLQTQTPIGNMLYQCSACGYTEGDDLS